VPIATIFFAVNVALIIHAAKTGRFSPWGYVLLFLPGIGAIAYVLVELLPEWLGSHRGQVARQKMARVVAPERRYRELTDELTLVDTIANRVAPAQECLKLGKFDEALFHYTILQARPLADEPQFLFGKARAQFGLRQPAAAIATFDELMQRWPEFRSADGHLLYAIALEDDGRNDEALANYANLAEYFPGPEPRVRQAQLLKKLGREADAKALAEDVDAQKRAPLVHGRASHRPRLIFFRTRRPVASR
jgi:hypothetical protein